MQSFKTKFIVFAILFGLCIFIYVPDSTNVFDTLQIAKEHLEIPDLNKSEFTYSGFTGYGSTREILLVLGKE